MRLGNWIFEVIFLSLGTGITKVLLSPPIILQSWVPWKAVSQDGSHLFHSLIPNILTLPSCKSLYLISYISTLLNILLFIFIPGPFTCKRNVLLQKESAFPGKLLTLHSTLRRTVFILWHILNILMWVPVSLKVWSSWVQELWPTHICVRAQCSSWDIVDAQPMSSGQWNWMGAKSRLCSQGRWVRCKLLVVPWVPSLWFCVCYFLAVTCSISQKTLMRWNTFWEWKSLRGDKEFKRMGG